MSNKDVLDLSDILLPPHCFHVQKENQPGWSLCRFSLSLPSSQEREESNYVIRPSLKNRTNLFNVQRARIFTAMIVLSVVHSFVQPGRQPGQEKEERV